MLGALRSEAGESSKNVSYQVTLRSFNLHHDYSNLFSVKRGCKTCTFNFFTSYNVSVLACYFILSG